MTKVEVLTVWTKKKKPKPNEQTTENIAQYFLLSSEKTAPLCTSVGLQTYTCSLTAKDNAQKMQRDTS